MYLYYLKLKACDFCLDSLLVTVDWDRSEAYSKLLINEVSETFD